MTEKKLISMIAGGAVLTILSALLLAIVPPGTVPIHGTVEQVEHSTDTVKVTVRVNETELKEVHVKHTDQWSTSQGRRKAAKVTTPADLKPGVHLTGTVTATAPHHALRLHVR